MVEETIFHHKMNIGIILNLELFDDINCQNIENTDRNINKKHNISSSSRKKKATLLGIKLI